MLRTNEFNQLLKMIPRLSKEQEEQLLVRLKLSSQLNGGYVTVVSSADDWLLGGIGTVLKSRGVSVKKPTLYDARRWYKGYDARAREVAVALEAGVTGKPLSSQEKVKLGRLVAEAVVSRSKRLDPKHIVQMIPYYLSFFDAAYPSYLSNRMVRVLISANFQGGQQ